MKKAFESKKGVSGRAFKICLLILLCAAQLAFSDSWSKTYGSFGSDSADHMVRTADGGYIVMGGTDSFGVGGDILLMKVSSTGVVSWQKNYGGQLLDQPGIIRQTPDGGYLMIGSTQSYGAGGFDLWLLKLDAAGEIAWQRAYGGPANDLPSGLQLTPEGGSLVLATTNSFGAGSDDTWLLKLDPTGAVMSEYTLGGTGSNVLGSLERTKDGGFVASGFTRDQDVFNAKDGWIVRFTSNGDIAWQKKYSGEMDEWLVSAQETPDGGFIVTGFTESFGAGASDAIAMKLDSEGNILWLYTYGGVSADGGDRIRYTSYDGGYLLVADTSSFGAGFSDTWLLKLDAKGAILWQKTYGGSNYDFSFESDYIASEKKFILAGGTRSFGAGDYDDWLIKITTSGDISRGCNLVMPTNVAAGKAFFNVIKTDFNFLRSTARINPSRAVPLKTNVTIQTQCGSSAKARR